MLVSLRRTYSDLITSGAHLVLIGVGLVIGTPSAWIGCCTLIAGISLVAWVSSFRRHRAISDTPTSRVASAAQGYVELQGRGRALGGLPLLSPLTNLPCLWYRYRVERRYQDKWVHEGSGESDASFILDDGSGQCLVDPEGAEMLVTRRDRWANGDHRYTQWLLIERDPLYALGQFVTRGSVDLQLDTNEDVRALLADWKKDQRKLLARFDLDRNGELDMREWGLARRQAKREVAAQHHELRARAEVSVMTRPPDQRLYLISDVDPARLERRYRFWSQAHLAVFFGALGTAAYVFHSPLS